MIRFIKRTLLISLLLNLGIANAFSQNRDEFEKELQRLDLRIERLSDFLTVTGNDKAAELLMNVQEDREQAIALAKQGQYRRGLERIKLAHARLDRAEEVIVNVFEGFVARQRNRINERFNRAEGLLSDARNIEAQRRFERAKSTYDKASRAYAAHQYLPAFEYYNLALTLIDQTLDLLKSTSNTGDTDVMTAERRKFENLRDRAIAQIEESGNLTARQTYDKAITTAQNALIAYRSGRQNLAKKLWDQAVLLLLRAVDLASVKDRISTSGTTNTDTGEQFSRLSDYLEQSRDVIEQSDNLRAKSLYNRAQNMLNQARDAEKTGNAIQAEGKAKLAENLIRRAVKIAQGSGGGRFSNNISAQLDNTRNEISMAKSNLQADSPAEAIILLNMAENALLRAEQSASIKANRLALESTLVAQRFLTRAEGIIEKNKTETVDQNNVKTQLGQLDAALLEAENRMNDSGSELWNQQLLQSAKDLRDRAAEFYERDYYFSASEAIQIAFDLLRKSLRNVEH